MSKCKITVLKRMLHTELAEHYSDTNIEKCPYFHEGQEFVCDMFQKPQGFCDWAWNDIYKVVCSLATGGNYNSGVFEKWMKNDRTMVVCCTDGIRPVSFKIERIEE